MALSKKTDDLWLEIQYAEKVRDERLAIYESQLEGYHSPFFTSAFGEKSGDWKSYNPENHLYEFISYVVPLLVYSNPRVKLNARAYGMDRAVTELTYFLNQWTVDNIYGEILTDVAHDYLFNFGCLLHTYEEHPTLKLEDGEPAMTVKAERLSQRYVFRDPIASTQREMRFVGHKYPYDHEDLLELDASEGWDLDAIRDLNPSSGPDEKVYVGSAGKKSLAPDRKQVLVYEIWIPEHQEGDTADGYNGRIYTFAAQPGSALQSGDYEAGGGGSSGAVEIRKPRDFFGPSWGPYSFVDAYYVPDDTYGLAPAVAIEGQLRDLNKHARGISDMASRHKRVVLVDNTDPQFVSKLRDAENDLVIPISGLERNQVVPVEVGGITETSLAFYHHARDRVDRISGLTEAQKGQISGKGTATEAAIADRAADIRTDFLKLQFQRFVRASLKTVAWYAFKSEDIRHVVGPEAAEELGIQLEEGDRLMFRGGDYDKFLDFEQLSLELEPMSMERVSEQQQKRMAVELLETLMNLAQTAVNLPGVLKTEQITDVIGQAFNLENLGDFIDFEAATQLGMAQLGAQSQPQPASRPGNIQTYIPQSLGIGSSGGEETLAGRLNGVGLEGRRSGAEAPMR